MTFADSFLSSNIQQETKKSKQAEKSLDIPRNIVYNKYIKKRQTNKPKQKKGEMQNETLQHEQLGKGSRKPDGQRPD